MHVEERARDAPVYTLKEEEIEMNTMEVEQNQTLMNIVQTTYSE